MRQDIDIRASVHDGKNPSKNLLENFSAFNISVSMCLQYHQMYNVAFYKLAH